MKYLKLTNKKESLTYGQYNWPASGAIVAVEDSDYKNNIMLGLYRTNKILVSATEEEYNSQN